MKAVLLILCLAITVYVGASNEPEKELLVITVATEANDGYLRFMRSIERYKLKVKVLGMGVEWKGGDVARYAGGGQKVRLIREAMEEYKDNKNLVVMFVDSYDVVFTYGADRIMEAFKKFDCRVVFSAEDFCWPVESLAEKYPEVEPNEKRFLNSGGFMGYAPDIYEIVTNSDIQNTDDDQLYYTKIFLNDELRKKHDIKLDTKAEIFQNLNGALDDVKVKYRDGNSFLYNMKTNTYPIVAHGNGPIKVKFNSLANYLAGHWTPTSGCQWCLDNTFSLANFKKEDFPRVLIGLYLDYPTAFAEDFFDHISELNYPKSKIDILIYYADNYHDREVNGFLRKNMDSYSSIKVLRPLDNLNTAEARNKALDLCESVGCQYYFSVDGDTQVEDKKTLQKLIQRNRTVIAPLFSKPGKLWSNFWGALNAEGYYQRSDDYVEILTKKRVGQWNVPYVADIFLVHATKIPLLKGGYIDGDLDPDMAFCKRMREKGIFMYLDNTEYLGHLVDSEGFPTHHLHNDLYMIMSNKYTWEKKYIHPNYTRVKSPYTEVDQPCPDVYWIPMTSIKFTHHLVEEMENFGQWSNGGNKDPRLAGGYENVPTVDIHMNQIGYEKEWLYFLKEYVSPLASKVFWGYFPDARSIMNFVVRYKPTEQDRLRPHHDSSTFTINIALNRAGIDFEGGGCRFTRYKCKVTNTKQGWMLMHPGRLTHQHEGLPVTKGTRYIMISFVDP